MLKYAVIGRNFIVDWFLEAACTFPDLYFYGVYSRNSETAAEYAKKHGAEKIYTLIEDICSDKNVDFVYIASPNLCHKEQAEMLLKAGKHVLCEKPAVLSEKDFLHLSDIAKRNNAVFMEATVPLHMPAFSEIKKLLPTLGKINAIDFTFCQYSSRYDRFKAGIMTNTFDPTLGNGSLMDLGIYCIEMLCALFGYPEEVSGSAVFLPESIDAVSSLVCRYNDKIAKITASKVCDSAVPSQIQGENACLTIDKMSRPKIIRLYKKRLETAAFDLSSPRPDMAYEIENFIRQISGEHTDYYNNISLMSIKLCDKAREKLGIDFKKR